MDDAVQMVVLGTSLADGQGSVDVASFADELEHVIVIRPPVFLVALRRDVIAVGIGLVGEYAAQRESLGQKAHVQIQSDLRVDVRDGRPRESGPVQASVGGIVVILRHDDLSVGRQRTGRRRRNDEQALVDAVQRVGRVIGRPLAADVAAQIDIAAQVLVQLDVHVRAVVEPREVRVGLVFLVLGLEPAALMQEADVREEADVVVSARYVDIDALLRRKSFHEHVVPVVVGVQLAVLARLELGDLLLGEGEPVAAQAVVDGGLPAHRGVFPRAVNARMGDPLLERLVEAGLDLGAAGLPALGRDDQYAVGALNAVQGCRRGVFEESDRLDLVRVDVLIGFVGVIRARNAVDDYQRRRVVVLGVESASYCVEFLARRLGLVLVQIEARQAAGQRLRQAGYRAFAQLVARDDRDGARYVLELLVGIAHMDGLVAVVPVGEHLHVDVGAFLEGNALVGISQIGEYDPVAAVVDVDRVRSVFLRDGAVVSVGRANGDTDQRLAELVADHALHGRAFLRVRGRQGTGQHEYEQQRYFDKGFMCHLVCRF